mmetsp:Transcript_74425/g.194124  ORF Transcript_74425/g.194124 Transcript_74425/m.194124 type:complete len:239 (+) Transcript_74425:454-1170(+)
MLRPRLPDELPLGAAAARGPLLPRRQPLGLEAAREPLGAGLADGCRPVWPPAAGLRRPCGAGRRGQRRRRGQSAHAGAVTCGPEHVSHPVRYRYDPQDYAEGTAPRLQDDAAGGARQGALERHVRQGAVLPAAPPLPGVRLHGAQPRDPGALAGVGQTAHAEPGEALRGEVGEHGHSQAVARGGRVQGRGVAVRESCVRGPPPRAQRRGRPRRRRAPLVRPARADREAAGGCLRVVPG